MDYEHVETCLKNLTEKAASGCKLFATLFVTDGPDTIFIGGLRKDRTAAKEYNHSKFPQSMIDALASNFGWSITSFEPKVWGLTGSYFIFLLEKK